MKCIGMRLITDDLKADYTWYLSRVNQYLATIDGYKSALLRTFDFYTRGPVGLNAETVSGETSIMITNLVQP